jgi:hypothetical protein
MLLRITAGRQHHGVILLRNAPNEIRSGPNELVLNAATILRSDCNTFGHCQLRLTVCNAFLKTLYLLGKLLVFDYLCNSTVDTSRNGFRCPDLILLVGSTKYR